MMLTSGNTKAWAMSELFKADGLVTHLTSELTNSLRKTLCPPRSQWARSANLIPDFLLVFFVDYCLYVLLYQARRLH